MSSAPDVDGVVGPPSRRERRVASLVMVSLAVVGDVIGPALGLWWARRHGSAFVRRYSWANLAISAIVLAVLIAWMPVFFLAGHTVVVLTGLVLWLASVWIGGVTAIALAVRAWRGHDVGTRWLPAGVVRRLPTSAVVG